MATFARRRSAIAALSKAGAELGALENDRYGAVTIESVADDEETLRTLLALGASAKLVTSRQSTESLESDRCCPRDTGALLRRIPSRVSLTAHFNGSVHWTARH